MEGSGHAKAVHPREEERLLSHMWVIRAQAWQLNRCHAAVAVCPTTAWTQPHHALHIVLPHSWLQVITTPFGTSFDHLRIADEVQYKFDRCAQALQGEMGRLPVYGCGHSLGALLHLLISARYSTEVGTEGGVGQGALKCSRYQPAGVGSGRMPHASFGSAACCNAVQTGGVLCGSTGVAPHTVHHFAVLFPFSLTTGAHSPLPRLGVLPIPCSVMAMPCWPSTTAPPPTASPSCPP